MSTELEILHANSSDIDIKPFSTDRNGGTYYVHKDTLIGYSEKEYNKLDYEGKEGDFELITLGSSKYNGRLLSEHNLSQLSLNSVDNSSYVITRDSEFNPSKSKLEFVLLGRYICLTDTDLLTKDDLWVSVKTINDDNYPSYQRLVAYDYVESISDSKLQGIDFTTVDNTSNTDYVVCLCLIEGGTIPTSSNYKFDTYSISSINGGTV